MGYMSPEYVTEGNFLEKSNVYSFEALILEIFSDQRSNHIDPESDVSLVEYVSRLQLFSLHLLIVLVELEINYGTLVGYRLWDYGGRIEAWS